MCVPVKMLTLCSLSPCSPPPPSAFPCLWAHECLFPPLCWRNPCALRSHRIHENVVSSEYSNKIWTCSGTRLGALFFSFLQKEEEEFWKFSLLLNRVRILGFEVQHPLCVLDVLWAESSQHDCTSQSQSRGCDGETQLLCCNSDASKTLITIQISQLPINSNLTCRSWGCSALLRIPWGQAFWDACCALLQLTAVLWECNCPWFCSELSWRFDLLGETHSVAFSLSKKVVKNEQGIVWEGAVRDLTCFRALQTDLFHSCCWCGLHREHDCFPWMQSAPQIHPFLCRPCVFRLSLVHPLSALGFNYMTSASFSLTWGSVCINILEFRLGSAVWCACLEPELLAVVGASTPLWGSLMWCWGSGVRPCREKVSSQGLPNPTSQEIMCWCLTWFSDTMARGESMMCRQNWSM